MKKKTSDYFSLYDLRVEIIGDKKNMMCSHQPGDYFLVEGENIIFPKKTAFSLYALAALLPLLPAKERPTHKNDWMTTDGEVACPDPYCSARFKITRLAKRTFRHSATSNQERGTKLS